MERKTSKRGIAFLVIGSLLIFTAVGWYICNTVEDKNAGKQASEILKKLEAQQATELSNNSDGQQTSEQLKDQEDQQTSEQLEEQEGQQISENLKEQEEQQEDPGPSVIIIDGEAFCGTVVISKLGIKLPIFDEWNYARLKTAPCRYLGSIATNDIIIAAHNYESHFGNLKKLQIGDEIAFIDASGRQHCFVVSEITTLDGTAFTDMKSGEWDFTLFTCTIRGEQRVTVRCNRALED